MEYEGPRLFREEDDIFTTFHWHVCFERWYYTEITLKFENI